MTVYIASTFSQTIQEAWDESEGLYVCTEHFRQHAWSLRSGYRLVPVPADMTDQVKAEGQCEGCWDNWADGLRQSCEADATARWEERLS